jgi:DNA-directed RNA polymerase specialized sigma subunit
MAFRKIRGHKKKTQKYERAERNREIYQLWLTKKDEMGLDEIGEQFNLTKSRICQIIKRQGELALAEEAER